MRKGSGDDVAAERRVTDATRKEWDALLARSRANPSMKARTRLPRSPKARPARPEPS